MANAKATGLSELAIQRLESLPAFQRWAAQTTERIRREVTEEAETKSVIRSLLEYFTAKGDAPPLHALESMKTCTDLITAQYWLKRAYTGETSAQIFLDDLGPFSP